MLAQSLELTFETRRGRGAKTHASRHAQPHLEAVEAAGAANVRKIALASPLQLSTVWVIRQMREIFVDCAKLFIIHLADRTPGHLMVIDVMAGWVDAGAQSGDEIIPLPVLNQSKAGSDRAKLSRHAATQIGAVTRAAVVIGEDIFAIFGRRCLGRGGDGARDDRLNAREQAGTQHDEAERI